MITIKTNTEKCGTEHIADTYRSLSANASAKGNYEILAIKYEGQPFYIESINFVESPSTKSRVVITIPADAICLAAKWDLYFIYDLDNDKVIDVREVIKRMMLTGHRESTLNQEIFVEYPTT